MWRKPILGLISFFDYYSIRFIRFLEEKVQFAIAMVATRFTWKFQLEKMVSQSVDTWRVIWSVNILRSIFINQILAINMEYVNHYMSATEDGLSMQSNDETKCAENGRSIECFYLSTVEHTHIYIVVFFIKICKGWSNFLFLFPLNSTA